MIAGPRTEVIVEEHRTWGFTAASAVSARTVSDVQALFARFQKHTPRCAAIELVTAPESHLGLGSKTSLLLSIAYGINKALDLGLSKRQLQAISGRGGTSGIGVNGFFLGGFLIDAGHPMAEVGTFAPSSSRQPASIPPVMVKLRIPAGWKFLLLAVSGVKRIGGADEMRFFATNTPTPASEVFESIGIVYHDLATSVREARLDGVRRSLTALHQRGFKRRELHGQSGATKALFETCQRTGLAAGLSSLGPVVYVIDDDEASLRTFANSTHTGAQSLGIYSGMLPRRSDS